MLTINGHKYAKNDREFADTLFHKNGTAYGYYKKHKGGVLLMNMQKEPFAFIVNNKHNEQFFVSCRKTESGKIRYMFSTSSADDKFLGLDSLGYIAGIELAQDIIKQVYKGV